MTASIPQDTVQRKKHYKICTLWVHDENFSRQDVVLNVAKFTECGIEAGSLTWVAAINPTTAVRDFQSNIGLAKETGSPGQRRGSVTEQLISKQDISNDDDELFIDENGAKVEDARRLDTERYYVFLAEDMSAEMKAKSPALHISLSSHVANVFGFRSRMQVAVSAVSIPQGVSSYRHFM